MFHMDELNIAENLVKLRHDKKITQEQLAEFVGVTKASVSKWETGQSMPDITILPQLAAFFDITVDQLIGYAPQLSKEQIQKLYQELAARLAGGSFEEVFSQTRAYVKKYYSCYPFLFRMCVLWLNHYMLAEDEEKRRELLLFLSDLCEHIKENCKDIGICDDIVALHAVVQLQLGRTQEVIEALEEIWKPYRLLNQSQNILVQAYIMTGKTEKAESFIQISIYNALLSLVQTATQYITSHMNDLSACEPTINRISQVEEIYALANLNPNLIAGFEYQVTVCCTLNGATEQALEHADKYVMCLQELFSSGILLLHGDDYFNKIEEWFEESEGGAYAPRDRRLVLEEVKQSFASPVFAVLEKEERFTTIKRKLAEIK